MVCLLETLRKYGIDHTKKLMAPSRLLIKTLKTPKTRHVSIDDAFLPATAGHLPTFQTPVTSVPSSIPEVTSQERQQWHEARKAEKTMSWPDRVQAMKRDGRLWYADGVWHRRGDIDRDKQWVDAKICELFKQGKIIKIGRAHV